MLTEDVCGVFSGDLYFGFSEVLWCNTSPIFRPCKETHRNNVGVLLGSESVMHEETKQNPKRSMCVSTFLLTGNNYVLWQLWLHRAEACYLSFHPFLLPHSATLFYLFLSVCCYDAVDICPHTAAVLLGCAFASHYVHMYQFCTAIIFNFQCFF